MYMYMYMYMYIRRYMYMCMCMCRCMCMYTCTYMYMYKYMYMTRNAAMLNNIKIPKCLDKVAPGGSAIDASCLDLFRFWAWQWFMKFGVGNFGCLSIAVSCRTRNTSVSKPSSDMCGSQFANPSFPDAGCIVIISRVRVDTYVYIYIYICAHLNTYMYICICKLANHNPHETLQCSTNSKSSEPLENFALTQP